MIVSIVVTLGAGAAGRPLRCAASM